MKVHSAANTRCEKARHVYNTETETVPWYLHTAHLYGKIGLCATTYSRADDLALRLEPLSL